MIKIRMVLLDQLFCNITFVKITLGIQIVKKFITSLLFSDEVPKWDMDPMLQHQLQQIQIRQKYH